MTHTSSASRATLVPGILCGAGAGAGALWGLVFPAPELIRTFSPLHLTIGRYCVAAHRRPSVVATAA